MMASLERRIQVEILSHHRTGLLLAVSDDLPGLNAIGRSMDELMEEIPVVIKALLEEKGFREVVVEESQSDRGHRGFERPQKIFTASLQAA